MCVFSPVSSLKARLNLRTMEYPSYEALMAWAKNMNKEFTFMMSGHDRGSLGWVPTVIWAIISITQVHNSMSIHCFGLTLDNPERILHNVLKIRPGLALGIPSPEASSSS